MFKRIDHVELITDQPDRMVRFYTEIMGFTVRNREHVKTPNSAMSLDIVFLDLGGTTIEVITYAGGEVGPAATGIHLGWNLAAFEVEDMNAAVDHLATKGVAVTWGPLVRETFVRAEINDPDGNRIELRQWK